MKFVIGQLMASAALACAAAMPAHAETLKFWTLNFSNPVETQALRAIIKKFEAENPGVTINMTTRGIDAHKAALRIAADSNQAPDIYYSWAGLGLGGEFVKSGLAAPMGKYYKKYDWDNEFLPASLTFSSQYANGLFGVPFTYHGEALYINKALFKKAGIEKLPTTYDELVADDNKLLAHHIAPITFGGSDNWDLMRLMDVLLETECGAKTHDGLMKMKLNWATTSCVAKSFSQLHLWSEKYILKPFMGFGEPQAFNLFLAGRAAMILEGDWLVDQLTGAGKKQNAYDIIPFPTGTRRLYGFASYNYISSKSKHPGMAAKFLNFMMSTPIQQKYLGDFGTISVNKNVKYSSEKGHLNREWLSIFRHSKGTYINGDQAFPLNITQEYWLMINDVATGAIKPSAAGGKLQAFIDNHNHG